MKRISLIFFVFYSLACCAQNATTDSVSLTISPMVNQEDSLNKEIIATLKSFLATKDSSLTANNYWLASDFEKYIYPYIDLWGIESGSLGKKYYKPSLMELVPTDDKNRRIVKIAYIGHNDTTNENVLKCIFSIVATRQDGGVVFSHYLDYSTKDWKTLVEGSTTYKISPSKTINNNDVIRQKNDISLLYKFLDTKPVPITHYSCRNPVEAFQIIGFDYNYRMYLHTAGGFPIDKNIIIAGNNSEYYLHEITHIYAGYLFPSIITFFSEGFATYIGGSGNYSYEWHRNKLKMFLAQTPDFKFEEHTDPFERIYFEHETPVPYLYAALVCERTLRLYGKEKLFEVLNSNKDLFEILKTVGLTKENINKELRKELQLPPTLPWRSKA